MPVAALMVIRPCVEVKAIEGDSLRVDGDRGEEGADFAVEAVFVHAEIGGGVAQANKARQDRGESAAKARLFGRRARRGRLHDHRRPWRTCGSGRSGTSCHSVGIIAEMRKKGALSIGVFFSETHLNVVTKRKKLARSIEPTYSAVLADVVEHRRCGAPCSGSFHQCHHDGDVLGHRPSYRSTRATWRRTGRLRRGTHRAIVRGTFNHHLDGGSGGQICSRCAPFIVRIAIFSRQLLENPVPTP
jgi:hypothetical protein